MRNITCIDGPNFSGRTTHLRRHVGLGPEGPLRRAGDQEPAAYVGPEVYNCISGLAATVIDELRLYRPSLDSDFLSVVPRRILGRNPFTLSGGEQATLAIAAAVGLGPGRLSLDCALEQIDDELRGALLSWLPGQLPAGCHTLLADNRLGEYPRHLSQSTEYLSADLPTGPPLFGHISQAATKFSPLVEAQDIELDGVGFGYPHAELIFRKCTLKLTPGRVYSLRGRNGAGKSTLAKLMAGVLRPKSGRFRMGGVEFQPWRHPGHAVAYHFQNPDLQLFETSVRRELEAGAFDRRDDVLQVAGMFGLAEVMDTHPLDLPFSMRKRVALAATVAMRRPWTIIDEPTLGQDTVASREIGRIIGGIAESGAGVILISHSSRLHELLADANILIDGGVVDVEKRSQVL
ncbi:MAG: ATP-binding cassette domain-containing protein [bacterium]|nr:ATP-binding cassette domain-containing protein [bacterium]